MTKQEFCKQYVQPSTAQAMALHTLPEGDRSFAEWQALWNRTLQQPVQ